MRVLAAAIGAGSVVVTLASAIKTFVLPRSAHSILTAVVFANMHRLFRLGARGTYQRRDAILAFLTPVTLFVLAGAWLAIVLFGFTAMFWATGIAPVREALWASASSLVTLGSADLVGTGPRLLAFVEAGIGLGLVAVLIAYLPTLYSAFTRREAMVALLEVRAGTPPSAVGMLARFEGIGYSKDLVQEWERWESWFVDIDESHTSLPMVVWLRSPQPDRAWVNAAGTVLDAASLSLAVIDRPSSPMAQLCIRAGYVSLRRIADYFGIEHNPDPLPSDPIAISRSEFDEAVERLAEAGIPIKADLGQAWRDFAGWRVNYDTVLLALADLTAAPPAAWVSDRSPVDHRRRGLTRWGLGGGSRLLR